MIKRTTRHWMFIGLSLVLAAVIVFALSAPTRGHADFFAKVKQFGGTTSTDCGRIDESRDPTDFLACSRAAIGARKAHFLVLDHQGIDSTVSTGVASDNDGKLHKVSYDSSPCGQLFPTPSCPARIEASLCTSIEYKVTKLDIAGASRWQVRVICNS